MSKKNHTSMPTRSLTWEERLHYRDRLRTARYGALADSEGFGEICFAIEAIGLRLENKKAAMGSYKAAIAELAKDSIVLSDMTNQFPIFFTQFDALYQIVREARNDVMHTGVYARYATAAAIELCIGLEEAIMMSNPDNDSVTNYMVKSPITVEPWQPVAYARQLMLTHSFSYLPIKLDDGWNLISELSIARYLHESKDRKTTLAKTIEDAVKNGLEKQPVTLLKKDAKVSTLLKDRKSPPENQMLWLIEDERGGISGVLSPFELM